MTQGQFRRGFRPPTLDAVPRAPRRQEPNAVYHVTARGNRGEAIYTDDRDRRRFLQLLETTVTGCDWRCLAYCLMTNHFHLLVATPQPNISLGMRALNGVYARWFNWRHGFKGHLFESRFHAVVIESDWHLLEASRYVLLNPARAGLVRRPEDWRWSSYRATAGLERQPSFLATSVILSYFGEGSRKRRPAFRAFVQDAVGSPRPL